MEITLGGWGGTTSFGVDFAQELEILATMKGGGAQMYSRFESGDVNIFTVLRGGGTRRKRFWTGDFPIL